MSLCFYGQTISASGYVYISAADDVPNANKSENFFIATIKPNSKTMSFSINGNVQNYRINSSNLTNSGKTLIYKLSNGMNIYISLFSHNDVIMFPWDGASLIGHIRVKLTDDDLRLLGLNR